jgi:pimeloyl-ACP methyl ester carboxylesterase
MATLGGHGFGAKVATATAISNMERCTGVINLEGGPLDHRYYEAYNELESYVSVAKSMDLSKLDVNQATKHLKDNISCAKWASIFV